MTESIAENESTAETESQQRLSHSRDRVTAFDPKGFMGTKSPGKDIDVYLRPLIDDLKVLWTLKGFETIDVATSHKFNMRAIVLWTINDFLAQSSLSRWSGKGYMACPTCNKDTLSVRALGKTAYVGHKRFLKKPHKLRRSLEFNGEIEDGNPPRKFNPDQIQAQLARLPMRVKGKHLSYRGVKIKRNVLIVLNLTKRSIFTSLNTAKAIQDLKRLGIRSGLCLRQTKNGKCSKPQAAHSFTPKNRKSFQYLPDMVAKPIIKLCSFFKQICFATFMKDDMLKAQSKVVDILCNLELIYPPAFFDIMIHLVIHLPLEALEAKPEGLIAEGYVAEEALTFSSHYFRDVTMKFNRPDRNVDPSPPTCMFQVFRSIYKSIGLRLVIQFDDQELKKVTWYVLHNSPEIDTYLSEFKSRFPRLVWVAGVSVTNELFALACGPTPTPISVNSCLVNGVRFVVHSRDECRTTQNSGICSPGGKDKEMYYGQLQEILELLYLSFKVVLFQVKWFNTSNEGRKVKHLVLRNNMTQILTKGDAFKDDQYILATQVKQCFYLEDMARRQHHWKVVEHVNHKKFSNGGVIMVEEDPNVIHFDNSSDLPLSTSLSDLDNATMHIDGQSIEVNAPPDIIDLDEDDDIIDDEDALPYDLAYLDDEDLVNVNDDDGVDVVYSSKGIRKPNLGGRKAGRLHTRQETRNLGLKKITYDKGPVSIRELIREMPFYYPSWQKVLAERKATILTKIGFDLKPHMQSQRWTDINAGIQQHLQKLYNTNKASLKAAHWVINSETGTNQARVAQNRQNRAKSTVMESSSTREYPSLIHTFFVTHTVGGVFMRDEDRALYDEMLRLQRLGFNTETGVPYTEEEIMAIVQKGKQQGHLFGVGMVLSGCATGGSPTPP
uniref:DUF4218 domain-containing protein n=1 Tax=Tanacetum cinerariifolium TaxID=118510 RepID=A0A6L2NF01_TANCI|nr:hypothetical protein [Tanacetum cinerariifolium]